MSSLLTGLIDCVARPSTSDSPVRVIRRNATTDTANTPIKSVRREVGGGSSQSVDGMSMMNVGGGGVDDSMDRSSAEVSLVGVPSELTTALFRDVGGTAIGDGDGGGDEDDEESDGTLSCNSVLETTIRQQFEAAFATFLYKNPSFTSMSYSNLARVRSKLARETARHARAEAELRGQLDELRESKRKVEAELQRELLAAARAKTTREAELKDQIRKTRVATMKVEENLQHELMVATEEQRCKKAELKNIYPYHPHPHDLRHQQHYDDLHQGYSNSTDQGLHHSYHGHSYTCIGSVGGEQENVNCSPQSVLSTTVRTEQHNSFQEEIINTRMEHAMLRSEMEHLRQDLADQNQNLFNKYSGSGIDDLPVSHSSYLEQSY